MYCKTTKKRAYTLFFITYLFLFFLEICRSPRLNPAIATYPKICVPTAVFGILGFFVITNKEIPKKPKLAKTGIGTSASIYSGILAISGGIMVLLKKRNQKKNTSI